MVMNCGTNIDKNRFNKRLDEIEVLITMMQENGHNENYRKQLKWIIEIKQKQLELDIKVNDE